MKATITLTGEVELLATLERAAAGLANPAPMLEAIGAKLESNIDVRWDLGEDPNGAKWPPLSPLTAAFRREGKSISPGGWKRIREAAAQAAGGSGPPATLEASGHMRNSLSHDVDGHTVEVGMARQTPGGKWLLPALHEFGTRSMPRRGLLAGNPTAQTLGAEDRQAVLAIAQRYLAGLV